MPRVRSCSRRTAKKAMMTTVVFVGPGPLAHPSLRGGAPKSRSKSGEQPNTESSLSSAGLQGSSFLDTGDKKQGKKEPSLDDVLDELEKRSEEGRQQFVRKFFMKPNSDYRVLTPQAEPYAYFTSDWFDARTGTLYYLQVGVRLDRLHLVYPRVESVKLLKDMGSNHQDELVLSICGNERQAQACGYSYYLVVISEPKTCSGSKSVTETRRLLELQDILPEHYFGTQKKPQLGAEYIPLALNLVVESYLSPEPEGSVVELTKDSVVSFENSELKFPIKLGDDICHSFPDRNWGECDAFKFELIVKLSKPLGRESTLVSWSDIVSIRGRSYTEDPNLGGLFDIVPKETSNQALKGLEGCVKNTGGLRKNIDFAAHYLKTLGKEERQQFVRDVFMQKTSPFFFFLDGSASEGDVFFYADWVHDYYLQVAVYPGESRRVYSHVASVLIASDNQDDPVLVICDSGADDGEPPCGYSYFVVSSKPKTCSGSESLTEPRRLLQLQDILPEHYFVGPDSTSPSPKDGAEYFPLAVNLVVENYLSPEGSLKLMELREDSDVSFENSELKFPIKFGAKGICDSFPDRDRNKCDVFEFGVIVKLSEPLERKPALVPRSDILSIRGGWYTETEHPNLGGFDIIPEGTSTEAPEGLEGCANTGGLRENIVSSVKVDQALATGGVPTESSEKIPKFDGTSLTRFTGEIVQLQALRTDLGVENELPMWKLLNQSDFQDTLLVQTKTPDQDHGEIEVMAMWTCQKTDPSCQTAQSARQGRVQTNMPSLPLERRTKLYGCCKLDCRSNENDSGAIKKCPYTVSETGDSGGKLQVSESNE